MRTFLGRSLCEPKHLSHLRRLKIYLALYPALPGWATRPARWRAPPALSRTSQIAAYKRQVAHPQARATTHIHRSTATESQPRGWSDKARAPEARHNLAQPGRAGNCGNHNSQHRRCDTFRPRATFLTPTALQTRGFSYPAKRPRPGQTGTNYKTESELPSPFRTGSTSRSGQITATVATSLQRCSLGHVTQSRSIFSGTVCRGPGVNP